VLFQSKDPNPKSTSPARQRWALLIARSNQERENRPRQMRPLKTADQRRISPTSPFSSLEENGRQSIQGRPKSREETRPRRAAATGGHRARETRPPGDHPGFTAPLICGTHRLSCGQLGGWQCETACSLWRDGQARTRYGRTVGGVHGPSRGARLGPQARPTAHR
jgi:hypothetical protein